MKNTFLTLVVIVFFLLTAAHAQETPTTYPAGVSGLAHINIATADLPASIAFYTEHLGFREVQRAELGSGTTLVLLKNNTCILELNRPADTSSVTRGVDGVVNHFALEVHDIEQVAADLQRDGIALDGDIFTADGLFGGIRGVFLRGPSGERIELFEFLDPTVARMSMRDLPVSDKRLELDATRKGPSVDFSHGELRISDNNRYIVHDDGTPFFYLGDTAWELFHRLSRPEAELYLENRRQKGFTVIQAVALAELDGLNTPNAYGDTPFHGNDPTRPAVTPGSDPTDPEEYDYWDHVDWIINKAAGKGIYIGLLPTWGDKVYNERWGVGPVVFTPDNARVYGDWIGSRYAGYSNIIWIIGGDRVPVDGDRNFLDIWRSMARAVSAADPDALMSYHTQGGTSTSQWFHNDGWLDFNMHQSGHSAKNIPNFETITRDYTLTPVKPCMDSEPCYEDHAVDWNPANGWFDEWDVRKTAWWGLLAGGHGTTYGCHPIWQFYDRGRQPITGARHYWHQALDLPGSFQMAHVRWLMTSRPMLERVPDQSLIEGDAGTGAVHMQAARGGDYAFIYIPRGGTVTVRLGKISGSRVHAWWFNPKVGESVEIGVFDNTGTRRFDPPGEPFDGNDWLLVLDDADKGYPVTPEAGN